MAKVEETIEVRMPIHACFEQWTRFEEFPQFMSHVKSIQSKGNNCWHWVVDGPMGSQVEWDAIMDGKLEDKVVSWHTLPEATVSNQGAVRFEELGPNQTRISASIQYEAPAGVIGETIANVFSNPGAMVKEDLNNFKKLVESKLAASSIA